MQVSDTSALSRYDSVDCRNLIIVCCVNIAVESYNCLILYLLSPLFLLNALFCFLAIRSHLTQMITGRDIFVDVGILL